ncbi:site-specific integrase [Sphingopyxis macrogoltabida]|uniref:site-specific integrase n=2 Tax=Sphingopyxis macrogoltabida TaxID=33050 RepID=UPI0009EB64DE
MFNWAVERGDLDNSPMQGMRVPAPPKSRDRVLSDNELLIIAAYADHAGPVWGPFFRLLILTGQRRTEVAGMRWEELDQDQHRWLLPPERVKNGRSHIVPLNRIAMGELAALAGTDQWPRSGFVFTHSGNAAVSGFSKAKRRLDGAIDRSQPGRVQAWRPHDLRRTVATNMQKLGVRFEVTEAILNHVSTTQAGVAGVYMRHDWADEKREALERWADWLAERVDEFEISSTGS